MVSTVDRALRGVDVGAKIGEDRDLHHAHAEVVTCLVEADVRAHRQHELGRGDAAIARAITVGLDGHEDALGAARGDRAADAAFARVADIGAEHARGHLHDLGFVLHEAGPDVRVQRVAVDVHGVDLREEAAVLGTAVINGARDLSTLDALRLARLERFHVGGDLFARATPIGQRAMREDGSSSRYGRI